MAVQNDVPPENGNGNNENLNLSPVWYNQEQTMLKLEVSLGTLKNYRKNKGLRHSKINGKLWFNETDLHNFILSFRK